MCEGAWKNNEFKGRVIGFGLAENVCQRLGAVYHGQYHQTGTYYKTLKERLKLRGCDPGVTYLIYYQPPGRRFGSFH